MQLPDEVLPPDIPSVASWINSSAAKSEEKGWPSIEKVRAENDRNWLVAYGVIVIVVAGVFTAIFLGSLIVWALHYMLPHCWTWLDAEQLSKIQSVLFSGGMGAVISSVIKSQMDRVAGKAGN